MDLATYFNVFVSSFVRAHIKSERGASLVEYALLVALIAVVCIGAASFLGGTIKAKFGGIGSSLSASN